MNERAKAILDFWFTKSTMEDWFKKDEGWKRTKNRRDYAMSPPGSVLIDWVKASGGKTYAIGPIRRY